MDSSVRDFWFTLLKGVRSKQLSEAAAGLAPPIAGYIGWWDASDTSSISHTTNSVTQWNDKSGAGLHVTSSGTARPTTNTRTINGMNVIDFNGSSNGLFLEITNLSPPITVFYVTANDITTGVQHVIGRDTASTNSYIAYTNGTAIAIAGSSEASGGTLNTSQHSYCAEFNSGANSNLWQDSTQLVTNASIGNQVLDELAFGSSYTSGSPATSYFDGRLAEVIIYNSILSSGDRNSTMLYLKNKWNTP